MDCLTSLGLCLDSVAEITSADMVPNDLKEGLMSWGFPILGMTTDRWPVGQVRSRWITITHLPDLCYCVSCKTVYVSRQDILTHFCSGKKTLGKRKNIEVKEQDFNVLEFLSWLLPQLIVDENPKQSVDCQFSRICQDQLFGAPKDCCFGEFVMWLLVEAWKYEFVDQNRFIDKLFSPPRQKIDLEQYILSTKSYGRAAPPTICIYDVNKKVKGRRDVNDRYKNCHEEDYDKVAYEELKHDNVEMEIEMRSKNLAGGAEITKKKAVLEILEETPDKISEEQAKFILTSCHKFSVGDAKRFLDLFTEDRTANLDPDMEWKYRLVERIWKIYGDHRKDIVCLDLDDPATYRTFEERIFDFIPIRHQFDHFGRPLKGDRVFEVFSITIRELADDRKFSLIYMQSDASGNIPLIIYKRPEGKEVDIGKPLPLRGLFRLPTPNSNVVIAFNTSDTLEATWYFVHEGLYFRRRSMCCQNDKKHPYDKVVETKLCVDKRNTSLATIKYRISLSALRAELAFTFFGDVNQTINITDGYIVATDNGDVDTKRVVQEYDEENPVCLYSGERLQVDRCVFGVPTDSYLRVMVKLVYFVGTSPEKRMIQGYHDFRMPEYVSTQGLTVPASDGSTDRLCVECFWTGPGPGDY